MSEILERGMKNKLFTIKDDRIIYKKSRASLGRTL